MRQGVAANSINVDRDTSSLCGALEDPQRQEAAGRVWGQLEGGRAFLSQCKCGFHSASTRLLLRPSLHDHPSSPFLNHLISPLVFVHQSRFLFFLFLPRSSLCKYSSTWARPHLYDLWHCLPPTPRLSTYCNISCKRLARRYLSL